MGQRAGHGHDDGLAHEYDGQWAEPATSTSPAPEYDR